MLSAITMCAETVPKTGFSNEKSADFPPHPALRTLSLIYYQKPPKKAEISDYSFFGNRPRFRKSQKDTKKTISPQIRRPDTQAV